MGYVTWRISRFDEDDKTRITSAADRKNYDLAFYPIPRAESVPGELREIVDNPIFLVDELTLGVVEAIISAWEMIANKNTAVNSSKSDR